MDKSYFGDSIIQGGDSDNSTLMLIVSRCGCGFDAFKDRLDKYRIPYIDIYTLIFPIIIEHKSDENVVDICIHRIIDNAAKYKNILMFFAMHVRQDIIEILEKVLSKVIIAIKNRYRMNSRVTYLNFDPLLLLEMLYDKLDTSSQLVDVGSMFDIFNANNLILTNEFPMEFMHKYTVQSIDSHAMLPDRIRDFFRQHASEYIYLKLFRNERFSLERLYFENITRESWYNDFDTIYESVVNSYFVVLRTTKADE